MPRLDFFFKPRSVAVVGATPKPGKLGRYITENLYRYPRPVYPVNPSYREVLGRRCYQSLRDVPETVDLAVVTVPAPHVPKIVREAVDTGVKGLVIVSGGFSEVGGEGARYEEEIREIIRGTGVRVLGPNCIGTYNSHVGLDMYFLPEERMKKPKPGVISIISQSGAYAATMMDYAADRGIGISKVVSHGNKVDVDDAELLEYFGEDEETRAIIIYLEGFKEGRGREFLEVARKVSRKKPIVVLKGGRSESGKRAVLSHTASLAGEYRVYRAAFKQCGIIEVEDFEEMFDAAYTLTLQPPMRGSRVAVVTNAGGFGVLCVDALSELGFELPKLPPSRAKELRENAGLPPYVTLDNPVDLTANGGDEWYAKCMDYLLSLDEFDGLLVVAQVQAPIVTREVSLKIKKALRHGKPIVFMMIGSEFTREIARTIENIGIPVIPSPKRAAKALKALLEYGRYLGRV